MPLHNGNGEAAPLVKSSLWDLFNWFWGGEGGGAGAGEWTCKPSRLSPYIRAWALGKRGFG